MLSVNTGPWQTVGRLDQPGQVTYEDISCVLKEAIVERRRPGGHATGGATRLAGSYTSTRDKKVALVAVGDKLQIGSARQEVAVGVPDALVTDNERPWTQTVDLPERVLFDLNDVDHFELRVCPRAWLRLIGFATEPKLQIGATVE
jgi:hypothetical protein